ncbi:hypothetical protein BLA29_010789, partial [Euroglyphus maynei]
MALNIDNETNYDEYLKPINFIATSNDHQQGSLIFFDKYDVLYTAYSNDYRDKNLQLPFISTRKLHDKGFYYARHKGNECSRIKLKSELDYTFKFITGFSYDNFAYFLFMESYNSYGLKNELRLGRICENHHTPLLSYMEIRLKCNEFNSTSSAHLSIALIGNEYEGFKLNSSSQDAKLLIGFNNDANESIVCEFSMSQIHEHFLDGYSRCTQTGRGTLIPKLYNNTV